MQKLNLFLGIMIIALLGACGNSQTQPTESKTDSIASVPLTPPAGGIAAILQTMEVKGSVDQNGPYPAFLEAKDLHEMLSKKPEVIDIRSTEDFKAGHIKGAKSVQPTELLAFWEKNAEMLAGKEMVVLVDADGQTAAYYTGLLRINGVKNVYSLKFGMSVWNKVCAAKSWELATNSAFENKLDTAENTKPQFNAWPLQTDSVSNAMVYFEERWKKLMSESVPMVESEDVFANPESYFIINYDRKDRYTSGHIPGAYRYKPEGLIGNLDEMATLPANKPIIVYCNTGQNAAYVAAYLRMVGYDAKILNHGCNSFMHNKMLAEKAELAWIPFTAEMVNNYPLVK